MLHSLFLVCLVMVIPNLRTVLSKKKEKFFTNLKINMDSGNYVDKGAFSPISRPRGRAFSASFLYNGYFWFWGGQSGKTIHLNDMWIYDPLRNEFKWVHGSNSTNQGETSITFGEFHANNVPSSRYACEGTVSTQNETFIFFAGAENDQTSIKETFNDVWEFSPTKNEFRKIRNSSNFDEDPVYGTTGAYDASNHPSTHLAEPFFSTSPTDFVTFIGALDEFHYYSQIWEFTIVNGSYRFLTGSKIQNNYAGNFPSTKGECGIQFYPPAKARMVFWWVDLVMYFFGGYNVQAAPNLNLHFYNDFWKYNYTGNFFCFLSGSKALNLNRYYKKKYRYHSDNTPNQKAEAPSWVLRDGARLLLSVFGGTNKIEGVSNDVWVYDVNRDLWKLTAGGSYSLSDGEINNTPVERIGGLSFRLNSSVFLFGGKKKDKSVLNDLWVYDKQEFTCFGKDRDAGNACSGNGECVKLDKCECNPLYDGKTCSTNYYVVIIVLFVVLVFVCWNVFVILLICFVSFFLVKKKVRLKETYFKMKTIKKGMKLKDVDILLKEQNVLEKVGIDRFLSKRVFKIKMEDLTLKKYIGSGGSGCTVYKGDWFGTEVSFKNFPLFGNKEESEYLEFSRELAIYQKLHPNVLKLFGFCLNENKIGLVNEFCEYGDLKNFASSDNLISLDEKIFILYQIASGMLFLHKNEIIHRDLKMGNVLISDKRVPKIMDFGLSKIVDTITQSKTLRIGTTGYMAPEMVSSGDGGKYTHAVDVYSFGVLVVQLLCFKKRGDGKLESFSELEKNKAVPRWIVHLTESCLLENPHGRPGFENIVKVFKRNADFDRNLEELERKEKKIKEPIVVYLKFANEDDEMAEDVLLTEFSFSFVKKMLKKEFPEKVGSKKVKEIRVKNLDGSKNRISNDKDVEKIMEDSIIEYDVK